MTHFADLTEYTYYPSTSITPKETPVYNVGWLSRDHPYTKGATSFEFRRRLWWLCQHPAEGTQTRGFHLCDLCPLPTLPPGETTEQQWMLLDRHPKSSAEIRVRGTHCWYAAPTLVLHYVEKHEYQPPDEFVRAVMRTSPDLVQKWWHLVWRIGYLWRSRLPVRLRVRMWLNRRR